MRSAAARPDGLAEGQLVERVEAGVRLAATITLHGYMPEPDF